MLVLNLQQEARTRDRVKKEIRHRPVHRRCYSTDHKLHSKVLWFDVSVDDVHPVQILDGSSQVEHHGTGVSLTVLSGGGDGVKQVTALKEALVEIKKITGPTEAQTEKKRTMRHLDELHDQEQLRGCFIHLD
ncbi:hypothetical protein INR49_007100 [Caranx melampygus]|nr:hypothetical protein INR49_007100 [Caranx melampygus]